MTLPDGWLQLTFEDVVSVNPRKSVMLNADQNVSFVPMAAVNEVSGTIVASSVRPYGEVARGFTHFQNDDVILAKITPSMENGKAAVARDLVNGTGIGSTEFHVLRSGGAIDPRFLWHFVRQQSFRDNAKLVMTGAVGQQRVPSHYLKAHLIPVPPLAEQRRIAQKLSDMLAITAGAAENLGRIPDLVAQYKRRLLAGGCSGELTASWRKAAGAPQPKMVRLGDVAESITYGSAAKSAKEGMVAVLRMGNIQDGKLDWEDLVFTSDAEEISKYSLQAGDVLFNRTNSPALVGKTAVYHGEQDAIYAGYLIRVRCGSDLLPDYLSHCLNSPAGRAYSWQVKSDGVSQSNINAKKLAAFVFHLPSLDEQAEINRQIAAGLRWLDQILAEHDAAVSLLPKVDATLRARAFAGKLCLQRPEDEPVVVLRKRLKNSSLSEKADGGVEAAKAKAIPMRTKRTSVLEVILADSDRWPKEGVTYPEIASRIDRPHDEVRDALFELLSGSPSQITQRFDTKQECIVLIKGAL